MNLLPYLEYWAWDNPPAFDQLDQLPRGHYALMFGSVITGFKFKGEFDTARSAAEWLEKRPLLGKVAIVPIQDPETHPVHVGSNPSSSEPDELDACYPVGHYIVITGNVFRGMRFWGYFPTLRSAVEWIEMRQPEIGPTTVMQLEEANDPPQVE